ncbi:MAG: sensor histidine kinase [Hydrogenovibrio sp.]|uniref:sensor histidine kinase n=1 Tax=Hydrogenovibrio sp. TaxID=2065821 RepID=UPI0028701B0F|nr:sensor histidine kinase [Hydrogenovibrio sp.]MDR9500009.1 sensor histidine kinase [Hydrogenovibrio sp.]
MKSIEKQLNLSLGLSLLIMFGVLWWLTVWTLHHLAEDYILERLQLDANSIGQHLFIKNGQIALSEPSLNPAYAMPDSGHYFALKTPTRTLTSSSLGDFSLFLKPSVAAGQSQHYETLGPNDNHLLVYQANMIFQNRALAIYVAEDHSALEQALWWFDAIVAVIVLLSLTLIYALQKRLLRRSFQQLDPVYAALDGLQRGEAFYLNADDYPGEVQPLIRKLNEALQNAQRQLLRSRQASSNLAHSLKTPLNIIFQLRQHPAIANDPTLLTTLQTQADNIHQRLETELQAANIAAESPSYQRFSPEKDLIDLAGSLQQLYPNKILHLVPSITHWPKSLPLEQNDGFELLGNLLDNAAKFSDRDYWLSYDSKAQCIQIEDDGPGVSKDRRTDITQRGVRLDNTKPGHGVGLAIANQIVDAYDLTLSFDASQHGGLSVKLGLKGGKPCP